MSQLVYIFYCCKQSLFFVNFSFVLILLLINFFLQINCFVIFQRELVLEFNVSCQMKNFHQMKTTIHQVIKFVLNTFIWGRWFWIGIAKTKRRSRLFNWKFGLIWLGRWGTLGTSTYQSLTSVGSPSFGILNQKTKRRWPKRRSVAIEC